MKKAIVFIMIAGLSLSSIPVRSLAGTPTASSSAVATESSAASATALLARLDEIKAIDRSTLGTAEKKGLRQEVKNIKKQLTDISGGVYISTGVLILIVVLLIILL